MLYWCVTTRQSAAKGLEMKCKMWNSYKVFENGDVVSAKGRKLKPSYNKKGYKVLRVKHEDGSWKTILHHKIIAEVFIGSKPHGYEVDHINGIRDDNRAYNLRYLTKSENNKHAYDSGRRDVSGFKNANCKHTEQQLKEVCQLLADGETNYCKIARATGVDRGTVSLIHRRKRWTCVSKHFNF